jgi:hypothetical protein
VQQIQRVSSPTLGRRCMQRPRLLATAIDPEGRVSSQNVNVGVELEERHVSANGNCRDEAIDQLPWCLTVATANAVQRSGPFVVDRRRGQEGGARQQSAEFTQVPFISIRQGSPSRPVRRLRSLRQGARPPGCTPGFRCRAETRPMLTSRSESRSPTGPQFLEISLPARSS